LAIIGDERSRLTSKTRPDLVHRLCAMFGDEKENAIKRIMHTEFNNSGNRYKDLTVSKEDLPIY